MRRVALSFVVLMLGLAQAAHAAGKRMVVVELYTSQGCSSCPPADEILTELSKEDDIIALGLHVDYWDYLGWKDEFAIAKFSERQQRYNAVLPSRYRLVTPQMVIHATAQVAGGTGASPMLIKEYVEKVRKTPEIVDLAIERNGMELRVSISQPSKALKPAAIQIVHFKNPQKVAIKRGENRGNKLNYTNPVSSWETVAKWDGHQAMNLNVRLSRDEPVAVIVQQPVVGQIYAARKLP